MTEDDVNNLSAADARELAEGLASLDIWTKIGVHHAQRAAASAMRRRSLLKGVCGPTAEIVQASLANRVVDWAAYVRRPALRVPFTFAAAIGAEQAIVCVGCSRHFPVQGVTGEHVLPKSQAKALLTYVLQQDGILNWWMYYDGIHERKLRHAQQTLVGQREAWALTIGDFDSERRTRYKDKDGLARDPRNLVPMCDNCNNNKGNRPANPLPRALNLGGWTAADTRNP